MHYKRSAKPILEYLTTIHANVTKKNLKAKCNPVTPPELGLDSTFSYYILKKFEEALALADNDVIRQRVEKASICAYVAVLETAKIKKSNSDGKIEFTYSEKNKALIPKFLGLAKKYNMTYYDEGTLVENKKFE